MNGTTILAAVVMGLVVNTAIAQNAGGGGGTGAGSSAGATGGANASAPAGSAAGVPQQGPSGTLVPPPQVTQPTSPGTFSPESRDGGGVPAGAPGAAGAASGGSGGRSTTPGSGIGGVLSPSAQTSISVNATTFRNLDTDGDSGLSRAELTDPELLRHFSRLDRNSDGLLNEQEYLLFGRDPDTR